jgi:hypothetical protein
MQVLHGFFYLIAKWGMDIENWPGFVWDFAGHEVYLANPAPYGTMIGIL